MRNLPSPELQRHSACNIISSRRTMRFIICCSLLAALVLSEPLHAQYASGAFSLKQASDLYDQRGYQNGAALTIDGKLSISQANGNVHYIYPISQYSIAGFPFQTTLTYAGSVAFTAFKEYQIGRD